MNKLLVVEDDPSLGNSLISYLQNEGYGVDLTKSLEEAKEKFNSDYSLVILDWMLPDGQGIDFLSYLKSQNKEVPVIMLTARTDLIDKVLGLESGASDYITKPFEPRELIARIRVQLRNQGDVKEVSTKDIELGDLVINLDQREVKYKGELKEFTKMEFDFLVLLAQSPNKAFSREEILNKVWGYENYPSTRTVDTHVLQLRQKLDEALIETVRGVGYRFRF